jgi:hypothetical protein
MRHTHTWKELERNKRTPRGQGGIVNCACGEIEILTARALAEFRRQARAGIAPVIDDEGIQLIAPRSSKPRSAARSATKKAAR